MSTEWLITDSIVASIPIESTLEGHDRSSHNPQVAKIFGGLQSICDPQRDHTLILCGRAHEVFHSRFDDTGTKWAATVDGGCEATIVLSAVDLPAQRMSLRYKLMPGMSQFAGPPQLLAEFNPTTILSGNNVSPAALADPETGAIRSHPSSDIKLNNTMFSLGFSVLDEMYRQATNSRDHLFRSRIRDRDIHLVRVQFAGYLPTPGICGFLQVIAILYGQTIADFDGIIQLATHLGLGFTVYTNPETHQVNGVMLVKRHGKKPLYSIVFYDKRERVAQMHQGRTLTPEEVERVNSHIRLDITAHGPGVEAIVAAARRQLKRLLKRDPNLFNGPWRQAFLNDEVRPTAWWLGGAIFVLSHSWRDRELIRGSFGKWLIPHVLRRILKMDVIAGFTSAGFHRLVSLDDPVAAAWRTTQPVELDDWASDLAERANCSKATVYTRRERWLNRFGLDIALPHDFYRDLLFYGPNSLTRPANRSAILRAVRSGNGSETVRLLGEAASDFDFKRTVAVGATINSPPLTMPIKVTRERLPGADGTRAATSANAQRLPHPDPSPRQPTTLSGGRRRIT